MNVEILFRPSYSLGVVKLAPGEKIRADAGAMVSMQGVTIDTQMAGGLFKSLGRSLLGGESLFQNFFQAGGSGGEVTLAPDLPGDVFLIEMNNERLLVQAGSYLASEEGIELSTKLSSKAFLSGEGLTMLEATGTGKLLVSSYGAIFDHNLGAGEKYIVDTTHVVAFNAAMGVELKGAGGLKATLLSGEGLVAEITGPGRLLMQTRSQQAFLHWLIPHIPKQSS
jgi:uncharacterized protein (TIGR00266 family)